MILEIDSTTLIALGAGAPESIVLSDGDHLVWVQDAAESIETTGASRAELVSFLRSEGRPIQTNDLWIAASAMHWGLRVLSADAHFGQLPQISLLALEP